MTKIVGQAQIIWMGEPSEFIFEFKFHLDKIYVAYTSQTYMAGYIFFWGVLADFPAARIFSTLQCCGWAPQARFTWGGILSWNCC